MMPLEEPEPPHTTLEEPLPQGTTFTSGLTANDYGFGIIGGESTKYLKADGSGQGSPLTDTNIFQTLVSPSYTITDADVAASFAKIPVTWNTPFSNANYVLTFSVLHDDDDDTFDVMPADVYNGSVTAEGFTASVYLEAHAGLSGTHIVVNAIGIFNFYNHP